MYNTKMKNIAWFISSGLTKNAPKANIICSTFSIFLPAHIKMSSQSGQDLYIFAYVVSM